MKTMPMTVTMIRAAAMVLMLAGTGCQTRQMSRSASTATNVAGQHQGGWQEGDVAADPQGHRVLVCRTERGDFLLIAADGHPMYGSQGSREHVDRYLAGENPQSTVYKPATRLKDLCAVSTQSGPVQEQGRYGLGEILADVEKAGVDKRKHFSVSYSMTVLSPAGRDVLEGMLMGPHLALKIGVQKELMDLAIGGADRQAIESALDRNAEETRQVLKEIQRLRLDRGDLVADLSGITYGTAVKGVQWLSQQR